MPDHESSEKQPKRRSRAGTVLLIIFLLLIGSAAFVFYSVSMAPLELDDPRQMADAMPMPAQDRFRFSSADQTAQISVGASDIWNFVLTKAGTDFLDVVNQQLSAYSLSVSGCGIHIDENGLQMNLELFYKDIRLIAKVPCSLEAGGQHFCLKPTGIKLGVFPLPIDDYLSDVKLEFDLQLPIISDISGISYEQGAILIAGSMKEDILSLIPTDGTLYRVAVFNSNLHPLADSLETEEGFAAVFAHLEQNPGDIENIYRDLFALADSESTEKYLEIRMGLTQRVFPGIDFSTLEAVRTELTKQMESPVAILERFFANVVGDYNGKVFRLEEGAFLKKLKPFHATNYGTGLYDALFEILDADSFFLVLVDAENGFTEKTPPLNKLADETQQFTQPVDYNKTYILGCVLRGVDGNPFVLYEIQPLDGSTEHRRFTLRPLSENDAKTLQTPGKFGVWTG